MKNWLCSAFLICCALLFGAQSNAQSLPPQIQALYPAQAGEIVFVDVRALRGHREYAQIKGQVLPEKFRNLEQWVSVLGVDMEGDVNQLSWAFLSASESEPNGFMGVAEGSFDPSGAVEKARKQKLGISKHEAQTLISVGKNAAGNEFMFAFVDRTIVLFGFRTQILEMLDRRTQGGQGLPSNSALRDVLSQVNGKAPIWIALNNSFAALAVKQLLPEASKVPGFENLASRVKTASLRFDLASGLKSDVAVRCQDAADSAWLATLMQLAVSYQAVQIGQSMPELARALESVKLDRPGDDRVTLTLSIGDSDLSAMLRKNTFALKF
ncbi:MAG: hypothetical protein HY046_01500 [Acidobacteria bacterium]|nr:hypothetical protein [Acidobacteriota bacterium]